MQQWGPYSSYWQTPYVTYPAAAGYPQAAQTYDYNHQTTSVSSAVETSSNPPPPGVDSKEGLPGAAPDAPQSTAPSGWPPYAQSPFQSMACAYTYPTQLASYRQPHTYQFNAQQPHADPSALPSYNAVPGTPVNVNQVGNMNWTAAAYGYYPYPTTQAIHAPGVYSQPWVYPPPAIQPVVAPSTVSGYQFDNNVAMSNVEPDNEKPTENSEDNTTGALQEPPSTFKTKGAKEQWSDELKDYVQRAFCTVDTKEEKDQMERILKEKLEYIFRNSIKVDWATEHIPTVPSKTIAAFQNSGLSRPRSINLVRPVQLPGPRLTGPARGSSLRLSVGMIPRGGRNIFASNSTVSAPRRRFSSSGRSSATSPPSPSLGSQPFSRRRARVPSRSPSSRSRSSSSRSSSSAKRSRPKRRRRPGCSPQRPLQRQRPPNDAFYHDSGERSTTPSSDAGWNYGNRKGGWSRPTPVDDGVSEHSSPSRVREDTPSSRGSGGGGGGVRGRGRRRGRGGKHGGGGGGGGGRGANVNTSRLSSRAARFKEHLVESTLDGSGCIARSTSQMLLTLMDDRDELSNDFEACQIVGTMQDLEKRYLRLTRAPEPHEVRPASVLKQSLEHIKQKWVEKSDYNWICEQFKSIRQDLTVQGIEDEFAVAVYEAHADAALDAGDFEEFHQCQSQLLRLYKEGSGWSRLLEFTAYRLLYYIFTLDLLGINTIMAGLRPVHKSNPCIRFALDVRSAWALHNYRRFFLFVCPPDGAEQPPLRCAQVIYWFLDRERKNALKAIFKVCVICLCQDAAT